MCPKRDHFPKATSYVTKLGKSVHSRCRQAA